MENSTEIWQTEVNGEVYETTFDVLTEWIAEGSLLPQDRVRRGNLRWIEAQKVPVLHRFFNAKELGVALPPVVTTSTQVSEAIPQGAETFNLQTSPTFPSVAQNVDGPPPPSFYSDFKSWAPNSVDCVLHKGKSASFHCETCANDFCVDCPAGNVCPMCGALCRTIDVPATTQNRVAATPATSAGSRVLVNDEVKKGANWFYWIAAMSVINSLIMLTGTNWGFAMGLAITQVVSAIAGAIAGLEEQASGIGAFHIGALVANILISGVFVLFGVLAGKGKKWAFILGLVLYSLDGLIYLMAGDFIGVAIHGLAIYFLISGLRAIGK
jgi:hypothetical protein